MDFTQKKVLTFEEGCQYLGYEKNYVHELVLSGVLPYSKPNNESIVFERELLENWMRCKTKSSNAEKKVKATTPQYKKPIKSKCNNGTNKVKQFRKGNHFNHQFTVAKKPFLLSRRQ